MRRVRRTGLVFAAAAVLVAGSGVAAAARTSQSGLFSGQVGLARSAAAATGSSAISDLGSGGWKVQSSATATQTGAQISTPGFNTSNWLPVASDDAGAPGTEIEALAQNGLGPGDTALQPVNQATSGP